MGTAGQIGLGFTGLDFAADIRDLVYDFSNWEWSGKHIGQTLLDLVGLVPGIGVVKNLDEAAGLVKNVIKNADLEEKTAKNVLDKVDEFMPALKRSMDSPSIAPLLGNIMKSSDEAAGVGKKVVKSGDEVKEGITDAKNGADSAEIKTLYHYTNEEGLNGITKSNQLNPSLKAVNPSDARYGNGQYLSDIVPGTKTPAQLSRELVNNPFQGHRFTHFIEIDVKGLNVVQGRKGVFVVHNETPLDLKYRIVNSGANK